MVNGVLKTRGLHACVVLADSARPGPPSTSPDLCMIPQVSPGNLAGSCRCRGGRTGHLEWSPRHVSTRGPFEWLKQLMFAVPALFWTLGNQGKHQLCGHIHKKAGCSNCEQAWWWGGAGCLGDQQAAMLGQRCKPLEAKNTYGTGCFVLLNTGTTPIQSSHGLLTTMVRPLCSIWPFARAWQNHGRNKFLDIALPNLHRGNGATHPTAIAPDDLCLTAITAV